MKLESREIVSACFPLLAAGAVWLERMITGASVLAVNRKSIAWLKRVYIGVILISTALMAPISLPILPVPVLEKYLVSHSRFYQE